MSGSQHYKQSDKWRTGFNLSTSSWIKKNIEDLECLPNPEEKWTAVDIGIKSSILTTLRKQGIITSEGTVRRERDGKTVERNAYQTTEKGFDAVCEYLNDRREGRAFAPCPCETALDEAPHTGVKNLGDGLYSCTNDGCDQTHTREEVDL